MAKGKILNLLTVFSMGLMGLIALPAQAATVTYSFVKTSTLTNVDDAEGRWQYDGGKVYLGATHVANYIRKKRVSFGVPSSVNKSTVETTVIWRWGDYNFTMQGSHYFGTGKEVGGVSATSVGFTAFQDATFTGDHTTATITY